MMGNHNWGLLVAPAQGMGPSMGAPSLLPRMLQGKAAALGWESPGSLCCPCTTRDHTAGTDLGIQLPLLIPWC